MIYFYYYFAKSNMDRTIVNTTHKSFRLVNVSKDVESGIVSFNIKSGNSSASMTSELISLSISLLYTFIQDVADRIRNQIEGDIHLNEFDTVFLFRVYRESNTYLFSICNTQHHTKIKARNRDALDMMTIFARVLLDIRVDIRLA